MSKANNYLEILAPSKGIAISPHFGNGNARNLDIFSVPGTARANKILVKESGDSGASQLTDLAYWIVKSDASSSKIYALDKDGILYASADSGDTWAEVSDRGGSGEGLIVWKDYVFVFEYNSIDVYGPISGSPSWTDGWQTVDADNWHPTLVSKLDGKLYFGAGRYVGSIEEVAGQNFAPGTSATYTFTQQALDLPEDYKIKCLAEQNSNLMIGTWMGSNIYDTKIADIFPWDGYSASYNNPIQLSENGINALINIGGYLYILAGIEGKIYKSNGVQAWLIAQIPISVINILSNGRIYFHPGAVAHHKGRLFFGVGSGSLNIDGIGVFSLLETDQGNILNFEHIISTGHASGTSGLGVTALCSISNNQLAVAWYDTGDGTYGIDLTSTTSYDYATDYSAWFESRYIQVGSYLNKKTFTQMECYLAKELATNEGIQIKFRVNLTDSFTTIGTYTPTEIGSGQSVFHINKLNIPKCEYIQIRVELLSTATTTPEFLKLILK